MKTLKIKQTKLEKLLKNFFFNSIKLFHHNKFKSGESFKPKTINGKEYDEYLENYKKMTRWQTI
jgi:hypothetical protein